MPSRYPVVVFAPNGGATFVVHLSAADVSRSLPTPMPEIARRSVVGRLALGWAPDRYASARGAFHIRQSAEQ